MTLPLAAQRLIPETFDLFESVSTSDFNNILPFLVSLQHVLRQRSQLLAHSPMLEDAPHT